MIWGCDRVSLAVDDYRDDAQDHLYRFSPRHGSWIFEVAPAAARS